MDLDDIPTTQKDKFPTGVSEMEYDTEEEILAFLNGLTYAGDGDVEGGKPFRREGKWVVRVRIGDWGDGD